MGYWGRLRGNQDIEKLDVGTDRGRNLDVENLDFGTDGTGCQDVGKLIVVRTVFMSSLLKSRFSLNGTLGRIGVRIRTLRNWTLGRMGLVVKMLGN